MSKKGESKLTIIITVFAILIILVLSFLFFYYATKLEEISEKETASFSGFARNFNKKESAEPQTNVITFALPEVLPQQQKEGNCFSSSVADPFRQDAFRCQVENEIYDPCFTTEEPSVVFCQINPLAPEAFLIKLEKPLPKASLLEFTQDSWAWFVKLEDGTYCSPFTGTRPFFGEDQIAYYGCKSNNDGEQIVLMGDLMPDDIWTAQKAIVVQEGKKWIIKSMERVKIDTVWQ